MGGDPNAIVDIESTVTPAEQIGNNIIVKNAIVRKKGTSIILMSFGSDILIHKGN